MGGPPPGTQEASVSASDSPYLVEVFRGCPHFLPCLVQELDTDAEKLLEGSVVGEEHRVEIVAGLTSWRKEEGKKGGSVRREMKGYRHMLQREMTRGIFGSSHSGKKGILKRQPKGSHRETSQFKVRWSDLPLGAYFDRRK